MKLLFSILLVFFCSTLFSQKYKYTLTLFDAKEAENNKEFSKKLYAIFDQSADFEVLTSQFLIMSDVDISEETFKQKMEEFGYTRIIFTKQEIINSIEE